MKARWQRFKEILAYNRGSKLAALVLAVFSWYAIRETISFESVITDIDVVPIVEEGWAIQELSPSSVDVVFRGSKEDLRFLNREQVKIDVDLGKNVPEGMSQVQLMPENVVAPVGVRAISVKPDTISISLDQEASVTLPIKVEMENQLPSGYEIIQAKATPASVTVKGPRLRLAEVQSIRTDAIDLSGRVNSFTTRVPLLPPSRNWVASLDPDRVTVEVTISEHSEETRIEDVAVHALVRDGEGQKVNLSPRSIAIRLKGRAELLSEVSAEMISVYVDCTKLTPGAKFDLPVKVHAPPGISVVSSDPPYVSVSMNDL